jgi:hypothetical protein
MQTLKDILKGFKDDNTLTPSKIADNDFGAKEIQLVARENNKKPGQVIFVREDGKVGFPTINSIAVEIGDVVHGKVFLDKDKYFLFEVQSVV